MHNNIMAAGSKDRPPMLGPGRYSQWRSRFLRYIDTKPNGEGLRKSILSGPYVPSTVLVQAVAATEANEMWIAIERLQQGESLNIQDVKTNLLWEFGKFTSRDGESMESNRHHLITHHILDILKQYQNEVNDIRAERIAKSANPLALLAAAQPYLDNYYQAPKPQTQRDKEMQKNLALLAKYFKRLYKPTNNNLRTSSNSRNKTEDTTPRYNNDNQSGQFGNQWTMTVAGARETVGSLRMRCENKLEQTGVSTQAEQADWLADMDEEINKHELEAHYSFMAKIQEVLLGESSSTKQPLEQVQNNDENNVFANERKHSEKNFAECTDERAALANLIANLTLDTEENKTILKQLMKANASLTQELKECQN
ncbi:hypothetical protein Tco_0534885 [Tanacetum coccineum]